MATRQATPLPTEIAGTKSLFRNVVQGSGLYSIAILGQRLISVLLLPITTRFLVPADYGVLDLLEQVSSVLALLLGASFSSAIGYFYFQTETEPERRRVISTTVIGATLIGLIAAAVCWPFAAALSRTVFGTEAVAYSLYIVFATLPPTFLVESLLAYLRVENRPGMWVVGSMIRLGVTAVGVILFVAVLRLRIIGVQFAALLSAAIPAVILSVYCFSRQRPVFDLKIFWRMMRFAMPLGLSGIAMFVINFGDRFVLRPHVSYTELGLYALAYKIGMLISAAYASFQIYWSAQAYGIMKRPDADHVFARMTTYVMLGVAFCGLGIVAVSKPVLHILADPAYFRAVALVPLLVIAYCIRSIGEFFRCLFLVEGKPGYDAACTWISSSVCLAGYFILIPRFGVWGAAGATAVTFMVFTGISLVWIYRLRPYRLEWRRLAKVLLCVAVAAALYAAVPVRHVALEIAWGAFLIALFTATLFALGFFTHGELQAMKDFGRRLRPGKVIEETGSSGPPFRHLETPAAIRDISHGE